MFDSEKISEVSWRYASDVVDGTIPACEYIRNAGRRALAMRDAGEYESRGAAALQAVRVENFLNHLTDTRGGERTSPERVGRCVTRAGDGW